MGKPSADEVVQLFRALSQADQEQALQQILGTKEEEEWITLANVAEWLELSQAQVSRLAKKGHLRFGKLLTNGEKRGKYRISKTSCFLYLIQMALHCSILLIPDMEQLVRITQDRPERCKKWKELLAGQKEMQKWAQQERLKLEHRLNLLRASLPPQS